jgi:hypothetical protein
MDRERYYNRTGFSLDSSRPFRDRTMTPQLVGTGPTPAGGTTFNTTLGDGQTDVTTAGLRSPTRLYEPHALEIVAGALALFLWAMIFAVGIIFPSRPYLESLQGIANGGRELTWYEVIGRLLAFVVTYTATNAAVLCCLTAWLGELGRRTRIDGSPQRGGIHSGDYIAAVIRGFLAYLAVAAGFIILGSGTNLFVTPTQADYLRMAAIVSLLGFLTGFSPSLFRGLEERFSGKMHLDQKPDGRLEAEIQGPAKVQVHADTGLAPAKAPKPVKPGTVTTVTTGVPNGSSAPV